MGINDCLLIDSVIGISDCLCSHNLSLSIELCILVIVHPVLIDNVIAFRYK